METEAKFHVMDPSVFKSLVALSHLGPYTLQVVPQAEDQLNTYYDTADGRLRSAYYGLRLREVEGNSVVTLKGPGWVEGGIHQRGEWEVEAQDYDPKTWPASEVKDKVMNLIGERPLQPFCTITTNRQHLLAIRHGQAVAEISLDSSTVSVGHLQESFYEVEIELILVGNRSDLDVLMAALQAQNMPLMLENRSKLEHGLALLDQSRRDNKSEDRTTSGPASS